RRPSRRRRGRRRAACRCRGWPRSRRRRSTWRGVSDAASRASTLRGGWRACAAACYASPMFTRLHHVGLVVRRLADGLGRWRDVLGLATSAQATVQDQGVRAALLPIGRSEIELLEPVNPDGGVAKFLERRGEGLHHVCFETPDVGADLVAARSAGLPLID